MHQKKKNDFWNSAYQRRQIMFNTPNAARIYKISSAIVHDAAWILLENSIKSLTEKIWLTYVVVVPADSYDRWVLGYLQIW